MCAQIKEYDDICLPEGRAVEQFSPYCDFRFVSSGVTPGVRFAVRILKPKKPAYLLAKTHGWHMSIKPFEYRKEPVGSYLCVEVDMRGRRYSSGSPDCNGLELMDVYDAIRFVKSEYSQYLLSTEVIYFESGSGGGGNALALAGKFPDLFSAVNALSPIADYAAWYEFDEIGEFRDEMDIWVGASPTESPTAYAARSGITMLPNVLTNVFICHGKTDLRVPYSQSDGYIKAAKMYQKEKNISLLSLDNVGNREHFGNILPADAEAMSRLCEENRQAHQNPVKLPERGKLVVCGYLVTKYFSVFLQSVNEIAHIEYDLTGQKMTANDYHKDLKITWF
jgi:pimeloyl-ACP methyl ester carboxylesterase